MKYLVREKLHLRGLLKSFCETDELYKLARRIPIVWTYYTMEGKFLVSFLLTWICVKHPQIRNNLYFDCWDTTNLTTLVYWIDRKYA